MAPAQSVLNLALRSVSSRPPAPLLALPPSSALTSLRITGPVFPARLYLAGVSGRHRPLVGVCDHAIHFWSRRVSLSRYQSSRIDTKCCDFFVPNIFRRFGRRCGGGRELVWSFCRGCRDWRLRGSVLPFAWPCGVGNPSHATPSLRVYFGTYTSVRFAPPTHPTSQLSMFSVTWRCSVLDGVGFSFGLAPRFP